MDLSILELAGRKALHEESATTFLYMEHDGEYWTILSPVLVRDDIVLIEGRRLAVTDVQRVSLDPLPSYQRFRVNQAPPAALEDPAPWGWYPELVVANRVAAQLAAETVHYKRHVRGYRRGRSD